MPGKGFLVERWDAPDPAPDGLAIIGPSSDGEGLVQHYFDARGVARRYKMTFDGETWSLSRESEDFSPLDFKQRFTAHSRPTEGASGGDGNL